MDFIPRQAESAIGDNGVRSLTRVARHIFDSPLYVVGFITLVALLLRLYNLGFKSLWFDEAQLYVISTGSLGELLFKNATTNSMPPLFVILTHLGGSINDSEFSLRLISCLAGAAAIPLLYLLATRFTSKHLAYFGALIAAISTQQIQYSQQVREYSLAFLLTILMYIVFLDFLALPRRKNVILLALCMFVSISTQYGLVLVVASLNVVFLVHWLGSERKADLVLKWVVIQAVVVCAIALDYVLALRYQWVSGGRGSVGGTGYLASAYWYGSPGTLLPFIYSNTLSQVEFALPGILALFLVGLGLAAMWSKPRNTVTVLLLLVPFIVTLGAALLQLYPYQGMRQDIFLTPMIYILAVLGFSFLVRHRQYAVGIIFTIFLVAEQVPTISTYLTNDGSENIRPLTKILIESYQAGDQLFVYPWTQPAAAYYLRGFDVDPTIGAHRVEDSFNKLDPMLKHDGRVWMLFSHCEADECFQIQNHAGDQRKLELVAYDLGAWLYLAH